MKKSICLLLLAVFLWALCAPVLAAASQPLDEIEEYVVSVTPQKDGSLDISYSLKWKVLDDTKEGPLTWVKVGIANRSVEGITAKSSAIRKIGYLSDSGDYVRIDLDREYHAGEIVLLEFTLHQNYMAALDSSGNTCVFTFTPGWFDGISIRSMTIRWPAENAGSSTADKEDDGLLTWHVQEMEPGQKLTARVEYPAEAFQIAYHTQAETSGGSSSGFNVPFVIIILAILFFVKIFRKGGGYRGGFGGRGGGIVAGHGCACAHACACACGCACACACAGGGRAGCSAKPFYRPAVSVRALQLALRSGMPCPAQDEPAEKGD